jgi:hypothetical protein
MVRGTFAGGAAFALALASCSVEASDAPAAAAPRKVVLGIEVLLAEGSEHA